MLFSNVFLSFVLLASLATATGSATPAPPPVDSAFRWPPITAPELSGKIDVSKPEYTVRISGLDGPRATQNGEYVVSASSQNVRDVTDEYRGENVLNAFNYASWPSKTNSWTIFLNYGGQQPYNSADGVYNGGYATKLDDGTDLRGEWIQVRIPSPAYVDGAVYVDYLSRGCAEPRILFSSDGIVWKLVYTATESHPAPGEIVLRYAKFEGQLMQYGRLVCTKLVGDLPGQHQESSFGWWSTANFQFLSSFATPRFNSTL